VVCICGDIWVTGKTSYIIMVKKLGKIGGKDGEEGGLPEDNLL